MCSLNWWYNILVSSINYGQEDPVLKVIHSRMKSYLNQQEEQMEQRIKYVNELSRLYTVTDLCVDATENFKSNREGSLLNFRKMLMMREGDYLCKTAIIIGVCLSYVWII